MKLQGIGGEVGHWQVQQEARTISGDRGWEVHKLGHTHRITESLNRAVAGCFSANSQPSGIVAVEIVTDEEVE